MNNIKLLFFALLLLLGVQTQAQESITKVNETPSTFLFGQLNLMGGYQNTADPNWGLASRGAKTQATFEVFHKNRRLLQRGYTPFLSVDSWSLKLALEFSSFSSEGRHGFDSRLRFSNSWIKFATKWDRTSLFIGNRSYAYGRNPKIDQEFNFLSSQASFDFGFGSDLGLFFSSPLSKSLDLKASLTMGGYHPQLRMTYAGDEETVNSQHRYAYHNTWLLTGRIGKPSFNRLEFGVFGLIGQIDRGEAVFVSRLGGDLIVKGKERWKLTNQISLGHESPKDQEFFVVFNNYNSFEWFINRKFRLGFTEQFKVMGYKEDQVDVRANFAFSLSYLLSRKTRIRFNPFLDLSTNAEKPTAGAYLQVCMGCGLRK